MATPSLYPVFLKATSGGPGGTVNYAVVADILLEMSDTEIEVEPDIIIETDPGVTIEVEPEPEIETC